MKKLLIVIAAIALVIWVISWFRVPEAVATSGTQPWPGGMGTLESVAGRFPRVEANGAAKKFNAIAGALQKGDAIDQYVWREITKDNIAIGEPPQLPDVTELRELLLREPIVWGREQGVVDIGGGDTTAMRVLLMSVSRVLVASALAKARANDPAAWDDLHAAWTLARTLDEQPQMMLQTASLAIARTVNGVAWKLPLPAPAWFNEVQERDYVRPLLASFQYQTASYWKDASVFPTKWHADGVEHDRRIAEGLFNDTKCGVAPVVNRHGSDLRSVWHRMFRYRAEREATANALRVREGKAIETKSRCSDGAWTYDGTTLRFSRELESSPADRPMPLVLSVKPSRTASV